MKEFNQEIVSKRFGQLPSVVQDAIFSESLASSLHESMHTAQLTADKCVECNQQVTLVLVGLATTKDFKEYVFSDLKLEQAIAKKLYDTVVTKVVLPVRDTLLKSFDTANDAGKVDGQEDAETDPYREQKV
jgi:hypothetical protein